MNEEDVAWINYVRIVDVLGNYLVNGTISVPNDPKNVQYNEVQFWATLPGNVIDTYYQYYGMTVEEARTSKYLEIDTYNNDLMDIANSNPYVGNHTRSNKNRARVNNRNNSAANPSTPPGLQKNRDKALIEYSDSVLDANDLASDQVEALSGVTPIMELDVPTMVTWPVWSAPQ